MQSLKRSLYIYLLLSFFPLVSFASARCQYFLSHLYLAGSTKNTDPLKTARLQKDQLANSKYSSYYLQILDQFKDDKILSSRALYILSHVDYYSREQKIGNYEDWLRFLLKSQPQEFKHRLFEGLYVINLLARQNVGVSLEPVRGFFTKAGDDQKSMDIELRRKDTHKVFAYKEIKQVGNVNSIRSALLSALDKAEVARKNVSRDVDLSALVYIDIQQNLSGEAIAQELASFRDATKVALDILENTPHHSSMELNSVVFAHLSLHKFIRIRKTPEGFVVTEGDLFEFPPEKN